MESDSTQPNINYIHQEEEDDTNNLYNSYMSFITSSNTAVRLALDILYNQQMSFNQIISANRPRNINFASSFPTDQPMRNYSMPIFTQNRGASTREQINPLPSATAFFPQGPNIAQYFNDMQANIANIPSADERNAAVEYVTFCEIEEPLNSTCSISHRDFSANDTVIRLCECRHIFDASSILQWFTRNSMCPLCRNDIRTPAETEINTPTSNPLPFAQQLAAMISEQLSVDRDFSGNINIELAVPGPPTTEQ